MENEDFVVCTDCDGYRSSEHSKHGVPAILNCHPLPQPNSNSSGASKSMPLFSHGKWPSVSPVSPTQYDFWFHQSLADPSDATATATQQIEVKLKHSELWTAFHAVGTEMMISKLGRRLFPPIVVSVSGLEADAMYSIVLELRCNDQYRYRYYQSKWLTTRLSNDTLPVKPPAFLHPDSPAAGKYWMKEPISFKSVRLTNDSSCTKPDHLLLRSLHKYEPRVKILKQVRGGNFVRVFTKELHLCDFISVTSYLNKQVAAMKIRHNPFAKAFRETSVMSSNKSVASNRSLLKSKLSNPVHRSLPYFPMTAPTVPVDYGLDLYSTCTCCKNAVLITPVRRYTLATDCTTSIPKKESPLVTSADPMRRSSLSHPDLHSPFWYAPCIPNIEIS